MFAVGTGVALIFGWIVIGALSWKLLLIVEEVPHRYFDDYRASNWEEDFGLFTSLGPVTTLIVIVYSIGLAFFVIFRNPWNMARETLGGKHLR